MSTSQKEYKDTPIVMVKAEDYQPQTIDRAVERLWKELCIDPSLFCGKKVLVKPNLLMRRRPEETTTTHPQDGRA